MKQSTSIIIILVTILATGLTMSATSGVSEFSFPGEIGIHMTDPNSSTDSVILPDTESNASITTSVEPTKLDLVTIIYSIPSFPFQSEIGYHLAARGIVRTLTAEEGMHYIPFNF